VSIAPTEPTNSENIATTPSPSKTKYDDDPKPVRPKRRRKSTSHLKDVPETLALRLKIKEQSQIFAESLDRSKPFLKKRIGTVRPPVVEADGIAGKISRLRHGADR